MLENLSKYKIILASNSPRRRELLAGLDIPFEVRTISGIDESFPAGLAAEDIPVYISNKKADAYKKEMAENELIITADTIVWSEGKVLGKPSSSDEAREMLFSLSGKTHKVVTGVSILTNTFHRVFSVSSEVTFGNLDEEEINYYVDKYSPLDKAGAYGIQEWIGYIGVTGLNGSFFNVMGLPVQRLYSELKKI